MANLIIIIFSIALGVALSLYGVFYSGSSVTASQARAAASKDVSFLNQMNESVTAWGIRNGETLPRPSTSYPSACTNAAYCSVANLQTILGTRYLSTTANAPSGTDASELYYWNEASSLMQSPALLLRLGAGTADQQTCLAIENERQGAQSPVSTLRIYNSGTVNINQYMCGDFGCFQNDGTFGSTGTYLYIAYARVHGRLNNTLTDYPTANCTASSSPSLSLSPTSLTFATSTNTASATQNITVTNNGNATATGIAITFTTGTNFTKSTTCGTTLAAAGTCTVTINSNSIASAGTYTDTLNVAYTGGTTQTASLTDTVTGYTYTATAKSLTAGGTTNTPVAASSGSWVSDAGLLTGSGRLKNTSSLYEYGLIDFGASGYSATQFSAAVNSGSTCFSDPLQSFSGTNIYELWGSNDGSSWTAISLPAATANSISASISATYRYYEFEDDDHTGDNGSNCLMTFNIQ